MVIEDKYKALAEAKKRAEWVFRIQMGFAMMLVLVLFMAQQISKPLLNVSVLIISVLFGMGFLFGVFFRTAALANRIGWLRTFIFLDSLYLIGLIWFGIVLNVQTKGDTNFHQNAWFIVPGISVGSLLSHIFAIIEAFNIRNLATLGKKI